MNNPTLPGILLIFMVTSCGGSYAPVMTDRMEKKLFEGAASLIEPKAEVSPETIAEYRRNGLTGILNITLRGTKEYQGLALISAKMQNPVTLEWTVPHRTVTALTETTGTGFILATGLTDDPDVLLRYLIETKLPSGGRYETEIARGGVVLRVLQKVKEREVLIVSLALHDPNEVDKAKKESTWELVAKEEVFDDFTNKIVQKEKTYTLPRRDADQLWLRLKCDEIAISSAATLRGVNEREKPDLVLSNVTTVILKRIDPAPNP